MRQTLLESAVLGETSEMHPRNVVMEPWRLLILDRHGHRGVPCFSIDANTLCFIGPLLLLRRLLRQCNGPLL